MTGLKNLRKKLLTSSLPEKFDWNGWEPVVASVEEQNIMLKS